MIDYSQFEFMYNWEQKRLPLTFIDTWRRKNDIISPEHFLWNKLEVNTWQLWPPSLFKKELKSQFLEKLQSSVMCENPFCP